MARVFANELPRLLDDKVNILMRVIVAVVMRREQRVSQLGGRRGEWTPSTVCQFGQDSLADNCRTPK
jgi:hypothetical protein